MTIAAMPDALTWTGQVAVFDAVYRDYIDLLCDALAQSLREGDTAAPELARTLREELDRATNAAFMRALLAPETSFRLIYRRQCVGHRMQFLLDALRLERSLTNGLTIAEQAGGWTALGDHGIGVDGARLQLPRLGAGLPFDTTSPHAAAVDLGGPSGTAPRRPFAPQELTSVVGKLNAALAGIDDTGAVFRDFVRRFNIVLIAQIDRDDEALFTSGSTGQYIGRSFVTNPHQPSVRPVDLAEALVHEGIHALLYMQEQREGWVTCREFYDPMHAKVQSPWTGAMLGVRPFLQACFVWYGLLHFWAQALPRRAFAPAEIEGRMGVAARGFLAGPLAARLDPLKHGITREVLDTISELQRRIVDALPLAA